MKATTKRSLDNYARDGIPTGGFCRAVLENDLAGAFGRADSDNRADLFEIVGYVYNELPQNCWGSRENVAAWLKKKEEERGGRNMKPMTKSLRDHMESDEFLLERFKAVVQNHATQKTAESWSEVYDFMGELVNAVLTLRMKCRDQEGQMGEVGKRLAIWARDPSHIGEFVDVKREAT